MPKIKDYIKVARGLPPGEVVKRAERLFRTKTADKAMKYRYKLFGSDIDESAFSEALKEGFDINSVAGHIRSRSNLFLPFYFVQNEEEAEFFRQKFPQEVEKILMDAEALMAHVFDLLGSGPMKALTVKNKAGGESIDWHVDFKSGYRWDPKTFYKEIKYGHKNGADVKVPWELSRFQHLTTLGQAYLLTGDEKYAREFRDQVSDWIDANPPMSGVNWACTMDVAIRAVNWAVGFEYFRGSASLSDEFIVKFLKGILCHGRHIMENLEWSEELTANHYLSDIAGLVFLGVMFPEFREAGKWLEFGVLELTKEIEKQVYPDGADFEASIPYHRLVLELFAYSALVCRKNGIELPGRFWKRLERMFYYTLCYVKPGYIAPQIGDNDSGRFLVFGKRPVNDHGYLLILGALLFGSPEFKRLDFDHEAAWVFGEEGLNRYDALPALKAPVGSAAFKDAGIYIMRFAEDFMIISSGPNGQNAVGGHCHNDKLSFELNIGGEDIVVDPGTYLYTSEPEWRNLFRSTAYHNTVAVDGEEQNGFTTLFSLENHAGARCLKWESTQDYGHFAGEHFGYARSRAPVIHKREIFFDKKNRLWRINDSFPGRGRHTFEWHFHFAPGVKVELGMSGLVLVTTPSGLMLTLSLIGQSCALEAAIIEGWFSPAYGEKISTSVVRYTVEDEAGFEVAFEIARV